MLFEFEEGIFLIFCWGVEIDNVDVEDLDELWEFRGKGFCNVFFILLLKCFDGEKGDKGYDWLGVEFEKMDEVWFVWFDVLFR